MRGRVLGGKVLPFKANNGVVEYGNSRSSHNRELFDFNRDMFMGGWANGVATAFMHINSIRRSNTRRQAYYRLRHFASYLSEKKIAKTEQFTDDCFVQFIRYVRGMKATFRTRQGIYNEARTVLQWMRDEGVVKFGGELNLNRTFGCEKRRNIINDVPSGDVIKKFLSVCYNRIDEIEQRVLLAEKLMDHATSAEFGDEFLAEYGVAHDDEDLVALINVCGRIIENPQRCSISIVRRLNRKGLSLNVVRAKLNITYDDLIPFYCSILIQTAGNPHSIWSMKRDCVEIISGSMRMVRWDKPRASSEQVGVYDANKRRSVPNLISLLKRLNGYLEDSVSIGDRKYLFIGVKGHGGVSKISASELYLSWDGFLKRNNLEKISFRKFRAAIAAQVYNVGGLSAAGKVLQHEDLRTTRRYLETNIVGEKNSSLIRKYQGELVRQARNKAKRDAYISNVGYETLFGTMCKDPYEGVAPGTQKGKLCSRFLGCLLCPSSVIPVDSVYIATKLRYVLRHLEESKARLSITSDGVDRYRKAYGPIENILKEEIIGCMEVEPDMTLMDAFAPLPELF